MDNKNENKKPFERKPNFDFRAKISQDGRFWIIERTETWILPRKYLDVITQNHGAQTRGTETSSPEGKSKTKGKRNANCDG